MADHIRALHPNPEQPKHNDAIDTESLPGCGDIVLISGDELPPVKEDDVFREQCPSCNRHKSRLKVVKTLSED